MTHIDIDNVCDAVKALIPYDETQYLNPIDTRPWYGLSQNDRTFRFATSSICQLPFGGGRKVLNQGDVVSAIVGGWQVQGVYQLQSG
jgi:hypothetical protein